jgi:pimeloyl-ACP methyl ester carboxylesterase
VVLTAGETRTMPGLSRESDAAMRHTWLELHGELASLSTKSDHRSVEGAGHYIHWDQPEAVVAAIRDVVTAVRESGPVRRRVVGTAPDRALVGASANDPQ